MIETYSYLNMYLIVAGLWLGLNLLGIFYSKFILVNTTFPLSRIRDHNYNESSFRNHLPLILTNLLLMVVIFPVGLYLMSDWILVGYQNIWITLLQLFGVLLIDDFYFYCYHRLLHKSPFLFKKIHKIHHRSTSPLPADYLYEHPLEWMLGLLGPFIAFLILGGVSFATIFLFLIIKVLHELDIHSGIKSSIYRYIPFVGINEHHSMHHKYRDVHFASVFSIWDYVFRTHHLSKKPKK